LALLAAACSSTGVHEGVATFSAHGSVEQLWLTGATPGARLTLTDGHNATVAAASVDQEGSALFRGLAPGAGYRVHQNENGARSASPQMTVLSTASAPPDTNVYDQTLPTGGYAGHTTDGYGYLTTRDGTKLAIDVKLPGPADRGPYPTVVEYSGYGYADPSGAESSISQIVALFGYAVVDVNMRGTGCSGGVFDYFEPLQSLDGYDVIETVSRQPWTMHHKVGMIGVSYGGISQLFVGATAPPDLAAIAPLSVIDDTATTLYPGGILNSGFAQSWATDRVHDSMAASATTGQAWAWKQIQAGDKTCEANQALRAQTPDLIAKMRANSHYDPKVADPLSPDTFVNKVNVPVFLACQWEDEQVGGHCPELASKFTGTSHKWFTFTNGTHIDSLDPATFNRWYDFLELYVAQRAPHLPDSLKALSAVVFKDTMGVDGVSLPPDSIQAEPDYQHALAAFQGLPEVRVLFDNGAGAAPGAPVPGFEQSFPSLPIPGTQVQTWYFGPGGALLADRSTTAGSDAFNWMPGARPSTDFTGSSSDIWAATPSYQWTPLPDGTAASYVTAPLTHNTVAIGTGSVDLWLQSNQSDTDLQVTLTEVRPDGQEVFVQDGWLRASDRKLDAVSTDTNPVPTFRGADVAGLPSGQWTEVRVPLYYSGHAFRAGSRIRVTVEAPGGDQPFWALGVLNAKGQVIDSIARTPTMPSRLVLGVQNDVNVPTPLPPCPALRGEPCRAYQPFANAPGPSISG
jgi:predicted acyl esterase